MRPLHLWLAALLPLAVGLTGCSQAKRSSQTSGEQPTTAVSISQPVASQPVASRSVTPTSQPVAGSQPTATPKTTASKPVVTLDPGPAKQTTKHKHETKHRPLTPREERRVVRKHSTRGISHGERFRRRPAKARGRRRGGSDGHAFAGLSARPVPKAEPKAAPPPSAPPAVASARSPSSRRRPRSARASPYAPTAPFRKTPASSSAAAASRPRAATTDARCAFASPPAPRAAT